MWANEVQSFEEMKKPGDWMKINYYETNKFAGIQLVCYCGDIVGVNEKWQFESFNPLTISPSINHMNRDGSSKCHYFIKNGEFVNAM